VGGEDISIWTSGNTLSDEETKEIKKCLPGDKLVFTDISAVGPDDRTRRLTPFTIMIK
jgi:hypothetical protein